MAPPAPRRRPALLALAALMWLVFVAGVARVGYAWPDDGRGLVFLVLWHLGVAALVATGLGRPAGLSRVATGRDVLLYMVGSLASGLLAGAVVRAVVG